MEKLFQQQIFVFNQTINLCPNSIKEIENIIPLCDKINICQGLGSTNNYSNIKSKLRQFEEFFARLRHSKHVHKHNIIIIYHIQYLYTGPD